MQDLLIYDQHNIWILRDTKILHSFFFQLLHQPKRITDPLFRLRVSHPLLHSQGLLILKYHIKLNNFDLKKQNKTRIEFNYDWII